MKTRFHLMLDFDQTITKCEQKEDKLNVPAKELAECNIKKLTTQTFSSFSKNLREPLQFKKIAEWIEKNDYDLSIASMADEQHSQSSHTLAGVMRIRFYLKILAFACNYNLDKIEVFGKDTSSQDWSKRQHVLALLKKTKDKRAANLKQAIDDEQKDFSNVLLIDDNLRVYLESMAQGIPTYWLNKKNPQEFENIYNILNNCSTDIDIPQKFISLNRAINTTNEEDGLWLQVFISFNLRDFKPHPLFFQISLQPELASNYLYELFEFIRTDKTKVHIRETWLEAVCNFISHVFRLQNERCDDSFIKALVSIMTFLSDRKQTDLSAKNRIINTIIQEAIKYSEKLDKIIVDLSLAKFFLTHIDKFPDLKKQILSIIVKKFPILVDEESLYNYSVAEFSGYKSATTAAYLNTLLRKKEKDENTISKIFKILNSCTEIVSVVKEWEKMCKIDLSLGFFILKTNDLELIKLFFKISEAYPFDAVMVAQSYLSDENLKFLVDNNMIMFDVSHDYLLKIFSESAIEEKRFGFLYQLLMPSFKEYIKQNLNRIFRAKFLVQVSNHMEFAAHQISHVITISNNNIYHRNLSEEVFSLMPLSEKLKTEDIVAFIEKHFKPGLLEHMNFIIGCSQMKVVLFIVRKMKENKLSLSTEQIKKIKQNLVSTLIAPNCRENEFIETINDFKITMDDNDIALIFNQHIEYLDSESAESSYISLASLLEDLDRYQYLLQYVLNSPALKIEAILNLITRAVNDLMSRYGSKDQLDDYCVKIHNNIIENIIVILNLLSSKVDIKDCIKFCHSKFEELDDGGERIDDYKFNDLLDKIEKNKAENDAPSNPLETIVASINEKYCIKAYVELQEIAPKSLSPIALSSILRVLLSSQRSFLVDAFMAKFVVAVEQDMLFLAIKYNSNSFALLLKKTDPLKLEMAAKNLLEKALLEFHSADANTAELSKIVFIILKENKSLTWNKEYGDVFRKAVKELRKDQTVMDLISQRVELEQNNNNANEDSFYKKTKISNFFDNPKQEISSETNHDVTKVNTNITFNQRLSFLKNKDLLC